MKTICPNCKREDTMNYDATWGICNSCGWRGNPSSFGWNPEEALKEDFPDDVIEVQPTFFDNSEKTAEVVDKLVLKRRKKEDRIIDVLDKEE